MSYKFYGNENQCFSINPYFKNIRLQTDLYDALLNIWCFYSCAPRLRDKWSVDNITLGQCSITAFLAQDIFGGKVYGVPRPDGSFHCYNEVDGVVFDLTSEQFGDEVLKYYDNPEQFREVHFANEEKRERYEYLYDELQYYLALKEKKRSFYHNIRVLINIIISCLLLLNILLASSTDIILPCPVVLTEEITLVEDRDNEEEDDEDND